MGTTKEEAEAHAGEQAELSLSAVKEGAKKQLGGEVQQVKEEVEEETEPQPPAPVPAGKVPTSRNPMKKMKDKMAKTNSPMSTKSDKSDVNGASPSGKKHVKLSEPVGAPGSIVGGQYEEGLDNSLEADSKRKEAEELLKKAATPVDVTDVAISIIAKPNLYFPFMFMSAWVLGNYDFSLVWIVFLAVGLLAIQLIAVKRKVQKRVINHANTFYDNPNPEKESMYWVNNLIKTIWINFPKTMEEQIILNANAAIEPNKPAFLEELCVEACSVGSYYPQLSNFRVWNESMEALKFDCEMSYESDFKLELKIKKGISIPIKLKNVTFKSALRLFLRFLPNDQRYVCYAWVSLLEPLEIDMSIQIFGIDVTEFPFIMWIVRRLIRDLSNEIMLVPNRVGLDLAAMQAFTPTISQLKPQPRPEDYNTNMFSSYANMSNAGLSAVKGVGHIGGSAVKGVGNVGVGAVKGVGNVGVGAVKGLGHVGKGAAGMAGSMSSSMIGINKKKKEKLSDNELLVEEEEHPADNKVPSSLQELPTESSSLSPDRPKKQKRSMSFTQKIFGHKHKDKKNDDIDE